jgi:transposase
VVAHHTAEQSQQLVDRERRANHAKRLRAILLARQGFSAPEVAACTGFGPRSVQHWVARYNRDGLAGLETKPGRPTPSIICSMRPKPPALTRHDS